MVPPKKRRQTDATQSVSKKRKEDDENFIWMKHNADEPELFERWRNTFCYRKEEIEKYDDELDSETYFNNWHHLKNPDIGHKLMEIDFELLYPEKTESLYKEWNKLVDNVERLRNLINDSDSKNLLTLSENAITEDERDLNIFKSLSGLMPPTARIPVSSTGKKKKFFRPSIAESQNSIIIHCNQRTESSASEFLH